MKLQLEMRKIHGLAEFIDGVKGGMITIDPRQGEREMLDTGAHEALHIAFPELDEEEVEEAAKIIASVIWKLGYRRVVKMELLKKRTKKPKTRKSNK